MWTDQLWHHQSLRFPPPARNSSTSLRRSRPIVGGRVVITSRGAVNRAVLVGEDYLSGLEDAAKKLRDIESGNARPASDFKLIGSGHIAEGVTDPLADIRAAQQALWDKKLASFGK